MTGPGESLRVGWRPGAFASAALCAAALLATAAAVHYGGLLVGGGVLLACLLATLGAWREARLDGPYIRLRTARSAWRFVTCHARAIDRLEYRRGALRPRLTLHAGVAGTVLRATGPAAHDEAFRQAAMWLIVHGRRQAQIDAALLDALAAMTDHAHTGQPHDTSHA